MSIIAYDKYKNEISSAEELREWAYRNIIESYIERLDDNYYDTGMTGWEAIFKYITEYAYENEENQISENIVVEDEQLYKIIRLANHEMNQGKEFSKMDGYFNVGYHALEEIEESVHQTDGDGYRYIIDIVDLEIDYPCSEIYNVVELEYPDEIVIDLNVDNADEVELYDIVKSKVAEGLEYGIDSPDYIDEVEITYLNYDIVSIEKIARR